MDMRSAVIVTVNGDVAVRMQLRRFPLPAVVLHTGQRLERGPLDLLEALTARDAKAAVSLVVDALDAHHQSAVDLGDRGKSRAAEAEPEVAHQDFYESLANCLILRFSHACRNDCGGEVRG